MRSDPVGKARSWRLPTSGDALVLGSLLLLFAGLSYLIAAQSEPPPSTGTQHRSTFSTDPGGWKAYYRLLETRKNQLVRVQRRPKEWPSNAGVVVTGPYSLGGATGQWSESEAKDALSWVSKGGTLIAFTDAPDDLTGALGLRMSGKSPTGPFGLDDSLIRKESSPRASDMNRSLRVQRFRERPKETQPAVLQPAVFLENVSRLKVPSDRRYNAAPSRSIVLIADKFPLAVAISYGDGVILAVSDPGIPDNAHLTKAHNARFVVQMTEAYTSKERPVIAFDEYHQGYREAVTFWTAIGRPGQLAFWQITGLFLLMAYSASRRFGLPRPLPAASRVSTEYVASLADLYRRARATDAALEAVLKIFWRDLCRAAGLPSDAALQEVAVRAAAQADVTNDAERVALAERIIATISECRNRLEVTNETGVPEVSGTPPGQKPAGRKTKSARRKSAFSEAELVRLVSTIEQLRKELEVGGRNHT